MSPATKSTRVAVAPAEFVKGWMTADSIEQLAEQWSMTTASIRSRSSKLRKMGVLLPKRFHKTAERTVIDVASLNAMVDELSKPAAKPSGKRQPK
jgi:hypothetical protein